MMNTGPMMDGTRACGSVVDSGKTRREKLQNSIWCEVKQGILPRIVFDVKYYVVDCVVNKILPYHV